MTATNRTNRMNRTKPAPIGRDSFPGAAALASGYVLTAEFSSVNGYVSESTVEKGTGVEEGSQKTTKTIKFDDPTIQKLAQKYVNQAYLVVREHCAPILPGQYFCPEADFPRVDQGLQELRDGARTINETCRRPKINSQRHTTIEIYTFPLQTNNMRVAMRAGKMIHDLLVELRSIYDSDERHAYAPRMRMAQNLWKLVTGDQRAIVQAAIDATEAQRPIMIARYGGRRGIRQIRRENNGGVPDLDYGPIDRAIALFAPAANQF